MPVTQTGIKINKFQLNNQTVSVLYFTLILILIFILFFPIVVTVYVYFDTKNKKLYFAIYIFKILKIFSGYACVRKKGGFYIHFKNKAVIIDKNTFKNFNGNAGIIKYVQPLSFFAVSETGCDEFSLFFLSIIRAAFGVLYAVLKNNMPFIDLRLDCNVYTYKKGICDLKTEASFCFNVFCIIMGTFAEIINKKEKVNE